MNELNETHLFQPFFNQLFVFFNAFLFFQFFVDHITLTTNAKDFKIKNNKEIVVPKSNLFASPRKDKHIKNNRGNDCNKQKRDY